MKPSLPILLSGVLIPSALACLWDSDTLKDETAIAESADLYDLITGQFPHHGGAYYRARISRLAPVVKAGGGADSERNDLAVAHIRVGESGAAEVLLKQNLADDPRDYVTLSNLGVLEKKRGDFATAGKWIAKALEVKPEGHMGLGDWYLKMLLYREKVAANSDRVPESNFLGLSYADSLLAGFELDKSDSRARRVIQRALTQSGVREKLVNLLRNDQSFADGFAMMGDHLVICGDLHLAFLAYSRAIELQHPNTKQMRRRRRALLRHWEAAADKKFRGNSKRLAWWDEEVAKAKGLIGEGADWLEEFQEMETKLVEEEGDTVRFITVQEALRITGTKKTRP